MLKKYLTKHLKVSSIHQIIWEGLSKMVKSRSGPASPQVYLSVKAFNSYSAVKKGT